MSVGVVAVTLRTAHLVRMVRGSRGLQFEKSRVLGRLGVDTYPFTDISILRGMHHHLMSIAVWHGNAVHGIQCTYQVDGVVRVGPRNFASPATNEAPAGLLAGPLTTVIRL